MFHLSFKQAFILFIAVVALTSVYRVTGIVRERGDTEEAMQKLVSAYVTAVEVQITSLVEMSPSPALMSVQEKLQTLKTTSDFAAQHALLSAFQSEITQYIRSISEHDVIRSNDAYRVVAKEISKGGEPAKQLLVYNNAAKTYNADLETIIGRFIGKILSYKPVLFLKVDGTKEETTVIHL